MARPRLDYSKVIEYYLKSGLSIAKVAKKIGITRQGLWKIFKRRGVKIRRK